jgi:hypothetical protein
MNWDRIPLLGVAALSALAILTIAFALRLLVTLAAYVWRRSK